MQTPSDVKTYRARTQHYVGDKGPWLEHLVEDEGLTLGEALKTIAPYVAIPCVDEKQGHMATILKLNKEVHFAIYRRFRKRGQITVERVAQFFKPILDKEIFLVTKLAPDEDSSFIERFGFQPLGVTIEGVRTFILNEIKYPCKH